MASPPVTVPPVQTPVIELFDAEHLPGIVECVTAVWVTDNVIARALGVTAEDYRPVARAICERALADRLGLMLREPTTDRVVGFYTAIDLVDELKSGKPSDSPLIARWSRMLQRGFDWYLDSRDRPLERGEVIYFNIGGTLPEYRSQGWIKQMTVRAALEFTAARGFQWVLAIATHPHSVAMSKTSPYIAHRHEIRFETLDDADLSKITEPSCAMVTVSPVGPRRKEDS